MHVLPVFEGCSVKNIDVHYADIIDAPLKVLLIMTWNITSSAGLYKNQRHFVPINVFFFVLRKY